MQEAEAQHQWLKAQTAFYKAIDELVPDKDKWNFILFLSGHPIDDPELFQFCGKLDSDVLADLLLPYLEVDDYNS